MRRAYKFLLRPTGRQGAGFGTMLADHCDLYDAALEERREARRKGVHVGLYDQTYQLPAIRRADPDQGRWSAASQQQTLRRLDLAFAAFFRRVKAGEKPGYPRFKGHGRFNSVTWPDYGNGCRWDSVPHPTVTRVYLRGIGHVRVHQHRAIKGRIKTITVRRDCGRWYVILSCDDVPAEPLEPTGSVVGIDMGITSFLTTSDGRHVSNPRPMVAAADRLADAQRSLRRKERGSSRRRKAVRKVTAIHAKVRRGRLDHAHKAALALVRDHDVIVHEDLQVACMNRKPKARQAEDGTYMPNGGGAKTGLNRSIQDAGWGVFLDVLRDKAEWAGRTVIAVDARRTSQRCAECGHVAAGNRRSQAVFKCLACGHRAHADMNAAQNILRAGTALREAQATREAA